VAAAECQDSLGTILWLNGRPLDAEHAHRRGIEVMQQLKADFPELPSYWHALAYCTHHQALDLAAAGRAKEAKEAYKEALRWQNRVVEAIPISWRRQELALCHASLAWFLATCVDRGIRNLDLALDNARKALELDPNEGTEWHRLGFLNCRRVGNHWSTLGAILYRAKQWQPARETLEKALQLHGGDNGLDCWYLAMICWQLGERAPALRYYEQAAVWLKKNQAVLENHRPFAQEACSLRTEAVALLRAPDLVPSDGKKESTR
jgi:tetratricopeptide (TPR) repeat protein